MISGIGSNTRIPRSPTLPDVPTLQEEGLKAFDLSSWYGMWFPAGTPRDRVLHMHAELARLQRRRR